MEDVVLEVGRAMVWLVERLWERLEGMWFNGFSLESVDGGELREGRGALGAATGHEEGSVGS